MDLRPLWLLGVLLIGMGLREILKANKIAKGEWKAHYGNAHEQQTEVVTTILRTAYRYNAIGLLLILIERIV